ncbi:alpha/beta hydrolase [Myxococcota bacterium]|nr:alpha/beta hydrolase [Myxococcota bacterium]
MSAPPSRRLLPPKSAGRDRRGSRAAAWWPAFLAIVLTLVPAVAGPRSVLAAGGGSTPPGGPETPELVYAVTDDGWRIALHRYRAHPGPGGEVYPSPVILCHGISSNRFTWALGPGRDLGRYLSERGVETFVLELRGSGASQRPRRSEGTGYGWNVDDHVLRDAPAAVRSVLERTGAQGAIWIGHSMGGMIALGYLERVADHRLRAAAVVGSPVEFRFPDRLISFASGLRVVRSPKGRLDSPSLLRFFAGPARRVPFGLADVVYAPGSIARGAMARMMAKGVDPISGGVLIQFARIVREGRFVSADGAWDYVDRLRDIDVPVLAVAGRGDNLAPPERVLPVVERISSTVKRFRVFGRGEGDSLDYGHVDLCNGDHAEAEVYPEILSWLRGLPEP